MLVTTVLLALTAGATLQVLPLVEIDGGVPVRCGFVYHDGAALELRVEKLLRDGAVLTALELRGGAAFELVTRSFDSRRDLQPVTPRAAGGVRLEADLQDDDAGGALFAELGVSGGVLRVGRLAGEPATAEWREIRLPAPLPRDVTALYLNCAGDLIRPE